jgi:hypothetical protein
VLIDVDARERRTIRVERGLNGSPVWLGPSLVAVNVIGKDQQSGFAIVDLATARSTDAASVGYTLAASSDGRRIAVDDARTGDVLVGERVDWISGAGDRMTRISGDEASGIEALAFDSEGARLAVGRRSDSGATVDLLAQVDGGWRPLPALPVPGDASTSMAWLH